MRHSTKNLVLALAIIFPVSLSITSVHLFVVKYVSPNFCKDTDCEQMIMDMITNALYFPNSLMMIPIFAGVVIDSIGAFNLLIGSEIIFFIGCFITGSVALFDSATPNSYYQFSLIQIGYFFIGGSFQCIRLGLVVFLSNTFILKNQLTVKYLSKAFCWCIIMQALGVLIPNSVMSLWGEEQYSLQGLFIFCWLANILAFYGIMSIIRWNRGVISQSVVIPDLDVDISWSESPSKIHVNESWLPRNEPIRTDETTSITKFLYQCGPLYILGVFALAYLQAASDFISIGNLGITEQPASKFFLNNLSLFVKIGFGIAMIYIDWTRKKLIVMTMVLFTTLTVLLAVQNYSPGSDMAILALYIVFSTLQQPMSILYIPYMLDFNLINLGKLFGIYKWAGTLYVTIPASFAFWPTPIVFFAIFLIYLCKSSKNQNRKMQEELKATPETEDKEI